MTVATSFYPFDAGAGSAITEAQWQKMARRWLGTGVFDDYLNELAVTADGSGMTVSVASGGCWIEGFLFESDAAAAQTITAADATNGRIDYVVVELDRTANTVAFKVVTGTAASSPVAPTLTQTDALWQMPLATVTVDAAVGVIAADKVTDQRIMGGPRTPATMTANAAGSIPLVVKGAAGQTAPLFEFRDAAGTVLGSTFPSGNTGIRSAASGTISLLVRSGGAAGERGILAISGAADNKVLEVRGAASQTANLAEFQNSAGTILASFTADGRLNVSAAQLASPRILEFGGPDSAGTGFRTVRVPN